MIVKNLIEGYWGIYGGDRVGIDAGSRTISGDENGLPMNHTIEIWSIHGPKAIEGNGG